MADQNPQQSDVPDAPDREKMDQIRKRRLEKLSGGNSTGSGAASRTSVSTSPAANTSPAVTPPAESKPSTSFPTASSTLSAQQPKPASTLNNGKDGSAAKPSIRITANDGTSKRSRETSEGQTSTPPPRKHAVEPKEESMEDFESRSLRSIFRITLDESRQSDLSGHKLIYLPGLKQELEEGEGEVRLSLATLDTAIMEAVSSIPHNKAPLEYLLPCWKRVLRAQKSLKGYTNEKDAILKEVRRLCMSSCVFSVTMPELYGREPNQITDSLVPYLLKDPEAENGIDYTFISDAVARFDDDETVELMLVKAMHGLSSQLSQLDMNGDYRPYVNALKLFSKFKPLLAAISAAPTFHMATSAVNIELFTTLGPFFRISPLQPAVTRIYFAGPKTMDKGHIKTSQNALRMTSTQHQKDLKDIIEAFVRAGDVAKNKVLDWFAHVMNENHKRRAMRVDERAVSSDGFMINVTVVMDFLCEPFMDASFSKVDRIDANYLRRKPRIDIKDETKINADQQTSDHFYETEVEGTSNFISEVFFLTLAAHHYGSEATNNKLKNLEKDIKHFQKTMLEMEMERPKFLNNPAQMAQLDRAVQKYNDVLEKAMSLKYAIEGVLFDDLMQARSLTFMRYVIVWALRLATSSAYTPGKTVQLPLPDEQPLSWKNLPEYVLEDIVGNFKFIFRYMPHIIISTQTDELVALCITFLRNSEYIKNPGIKAGLVTLLYQGTVGRYVGTKGVLSDVLIGAKFANDHLLHSLMQFYIECENTGSHTQFYDKFTIRYEIFQIIKVIWTNTVYQQRLTKESKINTDFFVRFVNLLLNDCTYVLDEALSKFPKIHDLQQQLRNPAALTDEEKAAMAEELQTAESQARSYMQLANETVDMMKLFTSAIADAFTMPEIVQRLADMMDYNLDTLAGPKSWNLKVDNPAAYDFHPHTLLAVFVDIYLNLGTNDSFVRAVAKDGRSYKPSTFEKAGKIAERYNMKSGEELAAWETLINKIKIQKALDDQAEEDLGEVPDEFLDPLMADIMLDPVILPHSKLTIDRSTIRSHLLSDATDPFNRQPMKIEDVVPDVEMKAKIDAWREERKVVARKALADKMDLSEG